MHRPRLQRLQWLFTDCPLFFVTTCTHQRRRLLDQEFVHAAFVSFCQRAAERGVCVGRYVLMPDHLHFFVAFAPHAPRLSTWVQSLKVFPAKALRQHGHGGTPWQKGFFDHVLRSQESHAEKWEYVKQNPVRAGLVKRWEDWPYQGEIHRLL
jgi:REP element-mobilizing transposase RayT